MDKQKDGDEQIRFDIQSDEAIRADLLVEIPVDYTDSTTTVTYETDEFTSVCPWTGLPDFATLIIRYLPASRLVELKSLKYYLTTYRNVGILQETAVNRILKDLVSLLNPKSMIIEAHFRERGGIRTKAVARYEEQNV